MPAKPRSPSRDPTQALAERALRPDHARKRPTWAELLKRTFEIDVLTCPPAWRTPRALRRDLEAARLAYVDESGRRFDAHSLRGMLATRLLSSGASVPAAQKLMRHSTSEMTVSTYARVRGDREEREALERLPDLLPAASEALRATGTLGDRCPSPCPVPPASGGSDRPSLAEATPADGPEKAAARGKVVEAAGIEPASRNHPRTSVYARVSRFGSRSPDAHERAAGEPASLVLAGAPRGAAPRPARCWRSPQAAGAPAENGGLETRPRENSCWQVSAVPGGFYGDPRPPARSPSRRKTGRDQCAPVLREQCSTARGEDEHARLNAGVRTRARSRARRCGASRPRACRAASSP